MVLTYAVGPDGNTYSFNIDGNQPSATEQGRIDSFLNSKLPPPPPPPETPSGWGAVTQGAKVGYEGLMGGLAGLAGEQFGWDKAKEWEQYYNDLQAKENLPQSGYNWLLSQAGMTAPYTIAAGLGALAGPLIGGGTAGALAGATAVGFPLMAGQNVERQKQEGEEVNLPKAYLAGMGQAAIEATAGRFLPGVGKLLGVAEKAAAEPVKKGLIRSVGRIGGDAVKAGASEGGTEAAQQEMERWSAGLSLTSPEALQETAYAGMAGAALGAPLGGVTGIAGHTVEGSQNKRADRAQEQAYADMQRMAEEGARSKELARATSLERNAPLTDYQAEQAKPTLLLPDMSDKRRTENQAEQPPPDEAVTGQPLSEKTKAGIVPGADLYDRALDHANTLEDKNVTIGELQKGLGIGKPKATALRNAMVERGDLVKMQDGRHLAQSALKELGPNYTQDYKLRQTTEGWKLIQEDMHKGEVVQKKLLQTFETEQEAIDAQQELKLGVGKEAIQQSREAELKEDIKSQFRQEQQPYAQALIKEAQSYGIKIGDDAIIRMSSQIEPERPGLIEASADYELDPQTKALKAVLRFSSDIYDPKMGQAQIQEAQAGLMAHEGGLHYLRDLGYLKDNEFVDLVNLANQEKVEGKPYTHMQRQIARSRGMGHSSETVAEEAVAEMLRAKRLMRDAPKPVKTFWQKLHKFLSGLSKIFKSTPAGQKVLDKIFSGEVGARGRDPTKEAALIRRLEEGTVEAKTSGISEDDGNIAKALETKYSSVNAPKDAMTLVRANGSDVLGFVRNGKESIPIVLAQGGEWVDPEKNQFVGFGLRHAMKHTDAIRDNTTFHSVVDAAQATAKAIERGKGISFRQNAKFLDATWDRPNGEKLTMVLSREKSTKGPFYSIVTVFPLNKKPLEYLGRKYSQIAPAPVYVSTLKGMAEQAKLTKASPDQWAGYFRNLIGNSNVRDEADWLDLYDWLDSHSNGSNNPKIPKSEVLDYLHANEMQIYDIVKDETEKNTLGDLSDVPGYRETKFEDWTASGGERYHEFLITLGSNRREQALSGASRLALTGEPNQAAEAGQGWREPIDTLAGSDPMVEAARKKINRPFRYENHWPEEDIIASLRFKIRKDINGKFVMHLEEIQSDWNQQGRKYGFDPRGQRRNSGDLADAYLDERSKFLTALETAGPDDILEPSLWLDDNGERLPSEDIMGNIEHSLEYPDVEGSVTAKDFGERLRPLYKDLYYAFHAAEGNSKPASPFKTTWTSLALKRAIRWAADNGIDKLTWTTGAEQTERYRGMGKSIKLEPFYDEELKSIANKMLSRYGVKVEPTYVQRADVTGTEYTVEKQPNLNVDHIERLASEFESDDSDITRRMLGPLNQDDSLNFLNELLKNLEDLPPPSKPIEYTLENMEYPLAIDEAYKLLGGSLSLKETTKPEIAPAWGVDLTEDIKQAATKGISLYSAKMSRIAPPDIAKLKEIEEKTYYSNLAPLLGKLSGKFGLSEDKAKRVAENFLIQAQDRMLSVGAMIDMIRKNGGSVTNENDPYFREVLFPGQTDARIQEAQKALYDPLVKAIKGMPFTSEDTFRLGKVNGAAQAIMNKYKDSPNMAFITAFLYARYAPERNAITRARNEPVKDRRQKQYEAGSGMTDLEAKQIMDWFSKDARLSKLETVADQAYGVIGDTNDTRVSGNLSPDFRNMFVGTKPSGEHELFTSEEKAKEYAGEGTVAAYKPSKYYVPLKGFLEEHPDSDEDAKEFARAGRGFSIRGKEDFSALGRSNLAGDIIAHIILQNEEAIVRAEKNKVGEAFLRSAEDNPDAYKDVLEIRYSPTRRWALNHKGVVQQVPDLGYKADPMVMVVKRGDREVAINFHDPRLAKAMTTRGGLGNSGLTNFTKGLFMVNRGLAAVRTSLSPEFLVSNAIKDYLMANVNISELEMSGLLADVTKNLRPAWAGIREAITKGTATSEAAKAFKDFKKYGGMTAFYGIRELSDTIQKVNKDLSGDLSGVASRSKAGMKSLFDYIGNWNLTIENGTRLAVFMAVRDKFIGTSTDPVLIKRANERAAFISKNATVNFNMGGEQKTLINSLYLFYNAGLQGTFAMLNPMIRSKKARKIWAGVFIAGIMQDVIGAMISPVDDDGENQYDKINNGILENNIVFMDPFGMSERGYAKLPMPYGFNAIYNAGRSISRALRGKYSAGEAATSAFGTMLDTLNPLSGSYSFLNFVAPTIADPFVDLFTNREYPGKPIYMPASPFGGVDKPASQRHWNNTNPIYTGIADWLHQVGGGGDYIPAAAGMEWSPEVIEYVTNFIGGGMWKFIANSSNTGTDIWKDLHGDMQELDINQIPMLRRVVGNITSRNDMEDYIQNRDKYLTIRQELNSARSAGNSGRVRSLLQDYKTELPIANQINQIENQRKKLNDRIKKIEKSAVMPEEQKIKMTKALRDQINALIGRANTLVNKAG